MTDVPHLIGGRYELEGVLGRGGMAEVRRGRDIRLGRIVAIKRLRSDLASDPTFQARFRREAQSAAALNHPTIVAVYDTGEEQIEGQTVPYIVMEYVEGRTLRDVLRSNEDLLPERALEIVAGVLKALSYSHHAGIVHRDIKPANVMLTPAGEVKVMDFGIARAIADTSATVTQTAAVIGTAQYLSPEQARGSQVDARSDLYSTGCLLYELLTGRPPFIGDSPVSVAYQHVREEAPPPSQYNPALSRAVDAVVLRALAKSPDDRYQSADDMRHDIERAMRGERTSAAATMVAPQTTQMYPAAPPPPQSQVGYAPEPAPRRVETRRVEEYVDEPERKSSTGWVIGILAIILLALVGFIGYQLMNPADDSPTATDMTDIVGKTPEEATALLTAAGFTLAGECEPATSDEIESGLIISQDPEAGTPSEPDTAVSCVVSTGVAQTTVPRLAGLTLEAATANLEQAGLVLDDTDTQDGTAAKDTVLSSTPPEGDPIADGGSVDLVVASGRNAVPDVRTQLQAAAEDALRAAGFVPGDTQTQENGDVEPGTVLAQDPAASVVADLGSTVTLTVATAPEPTPVPVPDVSDQDLTLADATATLSEAGYTAVEVSSDSDEPCQNDSPPDNCRVVGQDPAAGEEFTDPAAQTVTLTLEQNPSSDGRLAGALGFFVLPASVAWTRSRRHAVRNVRT